MNAMNAPTHPGEVIKDNLAAMGMTQKQYQAKDHDSALAFIFTKLNRI